MAAEARSLLDALQRLEKTAARLWPPSVPAPLPTDGFPRLRAALAGLEAAAPRRPEVTHQDRQEWDDFVNDRAAEPSRRAIRRLCWDPEISLSERFRAYLSVRAADVNGSALEGLICSCFARWPNAVDSGAAAAVGRLLAAYAGRRRTLVRWREAYLLVRGPKLLADEILERGEGPDIVAERWSLPKGCYFMQDATDLACVACVADLERRGEIFVDALLAWRYLSPARLKRHLRSAVMSREAGSEAVRERLLGFARTDVRLGDPRHPANDAHWTGINDAQQRVIEWLSQLDIEFFFDHVLPRGADRHGRKKFWLQYVGQVRRSRPLLCDDDRIRLRRDLMQAAKFAGCITGTSSAFLLDFGAVLVIEFAAVGNACFLYRAEAGERVVRSFWGEGRFVYGRLKQPPLALARVPHWPPGQWQDKAAGLLAGYGIRP